MKTERVAKPPISLATVMLVKVKTNVGKRLGSVAKGTERISRTNPIIGLTKTYTINGIPIIVINTIFDSINKMAIP